MAQVQQVKWNFGWAATGMAIEQIQQACRQSGLAESDHVQYAGSEYWISSQLYFWINPQERGVTARLLLSTAGVSMTANERKNAVRSALEF